MYSDIKQKLPDDYLVKVDRMSMSYSLETRVPFLDHRLIEYMVNVHKNVKLQGFEKKSVLRATIGKQLPESILHAPKKGFGVPLREWFKDDSFDLYFENLIRNSILNKKTLEHLLDENKNGKKDNGNFIYELIMLQNMLK
jgi:asparagine synthase (glutamine-hydrolysing)